MSQLNSLLESANPYKSLQSDAARLANKWNKTGLLEGIGSETEKNNMSLILENQAKQLVMEESNTGGPLPGAGTFTPGTGAQWAGVALPLVRKVFGQIAAKEFVSVQPMNLPSGLVFYLDFQYGTTKEPFTAGQSLYGNKDGNNPFGNGATGGLYGAGRFGYSINNTQSAAYTVASASADWYTDLQADSSVSQSLVDGDIVKLAPGDHPKVYDKAPSGRLYLDGNISVEENSQSIKDRRNLSTNGYLEITILITPKGNIHNNPIITFRGLPVHETDEFIYGLEEEIEKTTRTFKLGNKSQEHNLIDSLKIASRRFTKEKTGKKPFTNINLVRI